MYVDFPRGGLHTLSISLLNLNTFGNFHYLGPEITSAAMAVARNGRSGHISVRLSVGQDMDGHGRLDL